MCKKILITVFLLLVTLIIWQQNLLTYGIRQGLGQWRILSESVPIADLIKNPDFPDSLKAKIQLIQKVKEFAVKDLGLNDTDNYTTLYDQKGGNILWNLSACEPFALEPKTWWFPIVGSVPYKGFFDLERAKTEEEALILNGWDTRIRPVSGWSTLGWFSDPILSNMLSRSDGNLAELIIHELTHATVFVEGEIEFNENLASFIGVKGAIIFLQKKYKENPEVLSEYLSEEKDVKRFTRHLLAGTKLLDSLYNSFSSTLSNEEKQDFKLRTIRHIIDQLDTIRFHNDRYKVIFSESLPNNAYFMSFMRYHSSEDSLEMLLQEDHNGELKSFVEAQIAAHGK